MTSQDIRKQSLRRRLAGMPGLRARLTLPFLITLLLLAVLAAMGTFGLFHTAVVQDADERLQTARQILYREFKKRETILATHAIFLQQFQSLAFRYPDDPEIDILRDTLFRTLAEADIEASIYPVEARETRPLASLRDLFDQARRSGQPRFRYTKDLSGRPVLMVAAPLSENGKPEQILILESILGESFLHQATEPLGVKCSLRNLDGEVLARSDPGTTPFLLDEQQLLTLGSGQEIFIDHVQQFGHRHLLTAIPLGTSDLVLLSLEAQASMDSPPMRRLALQMAAGTLLILTLGGLLYYKTVNALIRPLGELQEALDTAGQGNLSRRLRSPAKGELGRLNRAYNQMCANLQTLYRHQPGNGSEADVLLQRQTRSQLLLERKEQELADLHKDFQIHQRETSALLQLNQAMISAADLDMLFDRILKVLNELLNCDQIVLLLYNAGESLLEVAHASGIEKGLLDEVTFTFDQGICGRVAQTRRLVYVKDLEKDGRNLSYHGQVASRGCLVSAPMIVKDRLIGVLNLHKHVVEAFSASELKLIQAVANQAAIAIDNAHLFAKSQNTAVKDGLTGLYSRRFFQDTLKREAAQARRFGTIFTTIMGDIDHFRVFNEKHGRMRGDALLRQVGQIILRNTRGIDMVGRFGNQQFVLLLPKTDKSGAVETAEKLRRDILRETFFGAAQSQPEGRVTMSFGVTEFPVDSKNVYELLNLAERALYFAKQQGRNRTVAWEETLERSAETDN